MPLKKIRTLIRKIRGEKYQKVLFFKKDTILRYKAIKYILGLETKSYHEQKYCKSCNFFSKNLNKKNFIFFYKKFNANIQLKEKYDVNTLKNKSNKNACFMTYILFTQHMKKNKKINNIQKLNTILKINDLLILSFTNHKHISLIKYFRKNIQYEKKLLNIYL